MPARGYRKPKAPIGDPNDPRSLERHLGEFMEWMGVHGYSPQTISTRQRSLGHLHVWLIERGVTRTAEVTKPMLDRYQRWLFHYRKANGQPLTFLTQKGRLSPVRAFFAWATKTNRILYNPASELELPRVEHRLPKHVLNIAEVETVMSQPDLGDPIGVRDRAILEVFYSTGVRRSELTNLRLFDIDVDRRAVHVRQGKGRKDRIVPIGERALVWVDRYLTDVRTRFAVEPDDGWLFLSHDGQPLSPAYLTMFVGRYVAAADLGKTGSCHLFRHTMATLMLEAGADIRFIQAILGHSELSTTQIYTRVSITQLRTIHDACHPGAHNDAARDPGFDDDEIAGLTDADLDDVAGLLDALDDEAHHEQTDRDEGHERAS